MLINSAQKMPSIQGRIYLGAISMHLGYFLKVKIQNGDNFGVAKISNIFGVFEIPDIFFFKGMNGRVGARAYV